MSGTPDVIVVGGGAAGLQAALSIGRMRLDVVVVDSGDPANAPAQAIGGLLGAHETSPLEPIGAACNPGGGHHQPSPETARGEAMRGSCDAQRAEHAHLAPAQPEAAEDLLLAACEQGTNAAETRGHPKWIHLEIRARRSPATEHAIGDVFSHAVNRTSRKLLT